MTLPKKIMIFGRPGSGKSTFALKLSGLLRLPLYHLDKYFFKDNWCERDYSEFLKIQELIVAGSSWIIDGNSTKSLEVRYGKADLVIYFNYPRWLCCARILKRYFQKDPSIDDRASGCQEKVSYSLLKYMWSFERRVADKITLLQQKYTRAVFIEVRNDAQLNSLKNQLITY